MAKVLLVGYGVQGKNHARVIRAAGDDPITVDPDPESEADYRSIFRASKRLKGVSLGVIATPAEELASEASSCLSRGMHVLVEKPGAMNLNAARQLQAEAGRRNLTVAIGFTERHSLAVTTFKEKAMPSVGRIYHLDVQRIGPDPQRHTCGLPLDLMVHDFDVLAYLGFRPRMLSSNATPVHATASLLTDSGTAQVTASYVGPAKVRRLVAYGDHVSASLDFQHKVIAIQRPGVLDKVRPKTVEPLAAQWRDFKEAVRLSRKPKATVDDAIAAIGLASRMDRA